VSAGDEGFLDRWSRRKRSGETSEAAEPDRAPGNAVAATPGEDAAGQDDLSDAELCAKLGLPDPAALGRGDDFRMFFAAGVPGRLRGLALRRFWKLNPALGAPDDLLDYAQDYSAAATALGSAKTTYEVGRGLRAHLDKLSEAAERRPAAGAAGDQPDDSPTPAEQQGPTSPPPEGVAPPRDETARGGSPAPGDAPPIGSAREAATGGSTAAPSNVRDAPERVRHMVFRSAGSQKP
jgi:hypothetical protein